MDNILVDLIKLRTKLSTAGIVLCLARKIQVEKCINTIRDIQNQIIVLILKIKIANYLKKLQKLHI